jgi:hypothetical protein
MNYERADAANAARERAAALLIRYPDLSSEELGEVHRWVKHIATSLDYGLLASDPEVASQYRAYREEYHDRFKLKDIVKIAVFVGIIASALAALALLVR